MPSINGRRICILDCSLQVLARDSPRSPPATENLGAEYRKSKLWQLQMAANFCFFSKTVQF